MSVKVKWNQAAISQIEKRLKQGTISLAYDISNRSKSHAPYLTGALVQSIRVQDAGKNTIYVKTGGSFGGAKVPYAKKRFYENRKHPATRFYLRKGMNEAMDGFTKHFRGVTK